jgi:hypothetical protein
LGFKLGATRFSMCMYIEALANNVYVYTTHKLHIALISAPPPIDKRFLVRACFGQNIGLRLAVYS